MMRDITELITGISVKGIDISEYAIENAVEGTSPTHRQYAEDIEDTLAERARQEDLKISFIYETSAGEKITKESKWNKFWQGAGWILREHGDEILKVALDLKYDTNYSGYNTVNQVSTN